MKLNQIIIALVSFNLMLGCNPKQEIIGNLTPKQNEKSRKWGYVDERGTKIVSFKYDNANPFSDGLARVRTKRTWSFIDKTGEEVIRLGENYSDAGDFSEGLAKVVSNDKLHGFIDTTGKIVIATKYENAGNFSDGLAWVYLDWKYGYIDKTGNMVIPLEYYYVEDFSDSFAIVKSLYSQILKSYSYIDKTGKSPFLPYIEQTEEYRKKLNKTSRSSGTFKADSPYMIVDGNNIEDIWFEHYVIFSSDNKPIPYKEIKTLIVKYDYLDFSQDYRRYNQYTGSWIGTGVDKTITSYGAYIIYYDMVEKKIIGHDNIRGGYSSETILLDDEKNVNRIYSFYEINDKVKSRFTPS